MGVVCAIGRNQVEVWDSIADARDGIGELTRFPGESFPTSIAAEVAGEEGDFSALPKRMTKRLSRTDLFAVAAAAEALEQSERSGSLPRERTCVATGTSTGGLLEGEDFYFRRVVRGPGHSRVSKVIQQPTSAPSDAIAKMFDLGGGVYSNATACASAGAAIGMAVDLLRSGRIDAALAGGSDALCRLTYSGFNVLQAVDAAPCSPFDESRAGITLGEGAGYLVLERLDDALARGAEVLAEIGGYGASCDAHHPTAPIEDGRGAASAMRQAISQSGATAGSIDYVNAHGTGTLLNDSAESKAIVAAVGPTVPTSSSKSFFGHTLGASGGIGAIVTILALRNQVAPPTLRLKKAAEDCILDYVPLVPRPLAMRQALTNTFGFGGSNVSILIRAYDPQTAAPNQGA
jgi:3-oxoacyl-[acyl-carrier-protein] synthase II